MKAPDSTGAQLRVIVLGYVVRGPIGGITWSNLQYLMGLRQLGHEVYFVEDSDDYPSCYDPLKQAFGIDASYGLQFASRIFDAIGLGDRWAYYDGHSARWLGPCADRIVKVCDTADLAINLGGVNPIRPWLAGVPVRALIDQDPVFTQIRHLSDSEALARALKHTAFFSFGENIGQETCRVPADGLPWLPTRHPIVLEAVPQTPGPIAGKFTTVMLWDSYPAREHDGVHYGMKSDSFWPYLGFPRQAGPILEVAVGSPSAPREVLRAAGWSVCDPLIIAEDPWQYRDYIAGSKAEFTVAKHGYVVSHSGWFSERSATYLACGRPVLTQNTGFSDWLPTGAGIIGFSTLEQAVEGIQQINSRYEFHCKAARAAAEAYFDAPKVLADLINTAMNCRPGDRASV